VDKEKRCSRCRRLLPRSAFAARRASQDGLQYLCKACQQRDQAARRAALERRGICNRCHKRPAEPGRKTCQVCLDAQKRRRILGGRTDERTNQ